MLTVAPRATVTTIAYPLATSDAERAGIGQGAAVGLLNGAWAGAMVARRSPPGRSARGGMRAAWLATVGLGVAGARVAARARGPRGREGEPQPA